MIRSTTLFLRSVSLFAQATGSIQTIAGTGPSRILRRNVAVDVSADRAVFNVVNLNGQEQISIQVPVDVASGAGIPVVSNNGAASATAQISLQAAQAGIFAIDGTQAAALHADFSLISAAQPAAPGETIIVFCTGLGAVNPQVATGAAATGLSTTVATYMASIAGQNAPVGFAALTPNFVALGQVNLVVPAGAPSGLQDLTLTGGGGSSNVVKIRVR